MSVTASEFNDDLKGIAAGFGFAAAYAWITVFHKMLQAYIPIKEGTIMYDLVSAVMVTVLSIFIFILIKNETKRRQKKRTSNQSPTE